MIKTMNSEMTTNSQLSITETKKAIEKQKLSKQLGQDQNHRNGHHMVGYQRGGGGGEWGKVQGVQGIRSIIGRYRIDRGRLRIV